MAVDRRVVITGLGVVTPIGIGMDAFWEGLLQQRCGIRRVEAFDPSGLPCQVAGELPPFQLVDFIPKSYRKSAKVMSRDITLAVAAAYHAVVDAGLHTKCVIERGEASGPPNIDSTRFGANIGAGLRHPHAARSLFSTYLTIVPTVKSSGILETEGSLSNLEKSAWGMAVLSRSKPV